MPRDITDEIKDNIVKKPSATQEVSPNTQRSSMIVTKTMTNKLRLPINAAKPMTQRTVVSKTEAVKRDDMFNSENFDAISNIFK
ncbi:hypothetical protein pdam_00005416 [Pocillopora damicornis]|uniref:Uncharacterized protein n=1 Tax=Pocillopora damicornis TaxID=46731 RepID=A0A3M6U3N6_POCDA|nr:hypothetical protein pdam_00005416 [Pocillopora damicornis]